MKTHLTTKHTNIFPRVRASSKAPLPASAPLTLRWLFDLDIYYVFVNANREREITAPDLPDHWTLKELHQASLINLDNTVIFNLDEVRLAETSFEPQGRYRIVAEGGHDASALCLNRLWVWLVNQFEDDIAVALPAEHEVWITPASHSENLAKLQAYATERYHKAKTPLLKPLLCYRKIGAWERLA